ncbi:MAG TPA: recombinase family protein, partial [Dehalococcoidia bacterium]
LHNERPLIGYRFADDVHTRYEPDPHWAPPIARAFERLLAGETLYQIAATLPPGPKNGNPWHASTRESVLRNPMYVGGAYAYRWMKGPGVHGTIIQNAPRPRDRWVRLPEATVPPLVSRELFDAVGARLA